MQTGLTGLNRLFEGKAAMGQNHPVNLVNPVQLEVATTYFSKWLKYFSASIAAAQPDPAAVTACL